MPISGLSPRSRGFLYGVIGTLAVLTIILLIFGAVLRSQLDTANKRLTRIEAKQVARETATKVGEIATCYASARGRPDILAVFRGIERGLDPKAQIALGHIIDRYEAAAPSLAECDVKALKAGYTRKDFPPQTRGEQNRP